MLLTPINFIYFVVFSIGLMYFKPSRWRDLFIFLLGLLVLFLFLAAILFLMDYEATIKGYFNIDFSLPNKEHFAPFQVFYLLLGILGISIAYGFQSFWRSSIFIRNTHQFLLSLLLVTSVISLFNDASMMEDHWHFAAPFTLYLGNLLGYKKRVWIPEVIHLLLLLLLLFYQYDFLLPIEFEDLPKYLLSSGVVYWSFSKEANFFLNLATLGLITTRQ